MLLFQVALLLVLSRLFVAFVPFTRLAPWLGRLNRESDPHLSDEQAVLVRRVRWAVIRTSSLLPWVSTCFTQAIAAKLILRRQQIESTLYLGAALNRAVGMKAHAWLRCGPLFVTGGAVRNSFQTVAVFS
ncbi:MAG: lasso peptide biosynthesis B2 protein [Candidatus Electrothrix sp. AX5]|nr:lasso peptide biosynthesis B2 protein [Candidatus Electrothrix sp. AX5]